MNDLEKILNTLRQSYLPEDKKIILIELCKKHLKEKTCFKMGEIFELVARAEAIYEDLKTLNITNELYELLFYHAISPYVGYNEEIYSGLINMLFFNNETRDAIINVKTDGENIDFNKTCSGIISFVKVIGPKLSEMLNHIKNGLTFAALIKYEEIIKLCLSEGIPANENNRLIQNELEKRFALLNPMRNFVFYQKTIAKPSLVGPVNLEDVSNPPRLAIKNESYEVRSLQNILYLGMQKYYEQTGSILYPYDEKNMIYFINTKPFRITENNDLIPVDLIALGLISDPYKIDKPEEEIIRRSKVRRYSGGDRPDKDEE